MLVAQVPLAMTGRSAREVLCSVRCEWVWGEGAEPRGTLPVEHLVEITHLKHENVLRLRLLQLRPLKYQASLRGMVAFAAGAAAEVRSRHICAQSLDDEGGAQQRHDGRSTMGETTVHPSIARDLVEYAIYFVAR